jgi:hypothetical protein
MILMMKMWIWKRFIKRSNNLMNKIKLKRSKMGITNQKN